jgi:hypothetical protein
MTKTRTSIYCRVNQDNELSFTCYSTLQCVPVSTELNTAPIGTCRVGLLNSLIHLLIWLAHRSHHHFSPTSFLYHWTWFNGATKMNSRVKSYLHFASSTLPFFYGKLTYRNCLVGYSAIKEIRGLYARRMGLDSEGCCRDFLEDNVLLFTCKYWEKLREVSG